MSDRTYINKVKLIVAEQLEIAIKEVSDDSEIYRTNNWDSFGHMDIIEALETSFDVAISDREVADHTSIRSLAELISTKLEN